MVGCSHEPGYRADIEPILQKHCAECHLQEGIGYEKSGFLVDSHESLMKGTHLGTIIDPGSAISSTLYLLVSGKTDPSIQMPHGKKPLSSHDIALLKDWIDQGAKNN
jgi:hypothetical protein